MFQTGSLVCLKLNQRFYCFFLFEEMKRVILRNVEKYKKEKISGKKIM